MYISCSLQRATSKSCTSSCLACLLSVFHQVAQYIKFEMPVLQSFITKLKEEEDREVQKLQRKYDNTEQQHIWMCLCNDDTMKTSLPSACPCRYTYLKCMIEKQLGCLPEGPTCRWFFKSTQKKNEESSSNHPVPHIFQSVSIHSELARCKFVHVWCVFYCSESDFYRCLSFHHHAQHSGKKSLSDSSPLEQNEAKSILFCFLLFCKLMAKINSQHKT